MADALRAGPVSRTRFVKQAGNHGGTGYPQARLLALVTCGTRTLIDAVFTHTKIGEVTLVPRLQSSMHPGMLVLADRNFDSATVADTIGGTGADFLIRGKGHRRQPVIARHPDGSFTSCIGALPVRIIDASVLITTGHGHEVHPYRLITTLTDPVRYPAHQLVALYHERWEIETAFLELKSTIGDGRVLRARTAPGIEQEIYALLIAYQLIRTTISDATYMGGIDPDRGSFNIAFEAAKEQVILAGHHIDESAIDLVGTIGARVLAAPLPRRRLRVCPRVVKRAISKYQARGVVDRTCRQATLEISIHSGASP